MMLTSSLALVGTLCACACPDPGSAASSSPDPAATAIAAPCDEQVHRAFDFWLGEWEVKIADGTLAGHNRIERAHGGCALIEHWESARGNRGTSINYYDPVKAKWVQNWIDASGTVIQLEGELEGDSLVLVGRIAVPDGTESMMRGTWTPLEDGRVRQAFDVSKDEGASWEPWFEGFYSKA